MLQYKFKIILCLILSMCVSCQKTHKNDTLELIDLARIHFSKEKIVFNTEIEYCIIIPEGGCSGCIASGISFIKEHVEAFGIKQKKNKVVFTNIQSQKMLKRSLESVTFDELNCIIDTTDRYLIRCKEMIYPIVLKLEKGKIINAKVQSPKENGLYEIENRL